MLTRSAAVLCVLAFCAPAMAHEGHDHGDTAMAAPPQAGPRAEAASASFELVAVPHGASLMLYLDRFADNAPVVGASVRVEGPEGAVTARPEADGRYLLPAPWLGSRRHHDLVVTVILGERAEVLDLDLALPMSEPAAPPGDPEPPAWLVAVHHHLDHQGVIGAAAAGFLLGLATTMLGRARRAVPALAVLALTLTLLLGGVAFAHEDHEGASSVTGAALDAPTSPVLERARRLPDGAVFVPKSAQHLLGLRTAILRSDEHRRTIELPGRVIADPNASGIVQSSVGGRLAAPPGGFPNLGARVRRGDVLAIVTPPVQAVDLSDMRQTQGDLDQQIAIVARRVARYERLVPSGAVARTALDDARAELSGLSDRRGALDTIRREPEALTAPVDGVVAERAASAGQMAAPGVMVFRIVDPDRLYVEAPSFEAVEPGGTATARLSDGRRLALAYRGAGLAERNQAVPVQFAVEGGLQGLRLGQFVTVFAPIGGVRRGLAVARSGVVRTEGGSVVYEHVRAERFEPRPVRVEPWDADHVLVADGLAAGRRIVTEGAELLDQVR